MAAIQSKACAGGKPAQNRHARSITAFIYASGDILTLALRLISMAAMVHVQYH